MDIHYFDHEADIGIIGYGMTLEASFEDAARAMFSIMADLSKVHAQAAFRFDFIEEDIELAFVTYLNLLLSESNAKNQIFSEFHLTKKGHHWMGEAFGEKWRDDLERGTDVKGATLTMLSVKKINGTWESHCVVDV